MEKDLHAVARYGDRGFGPAWSVWGWWVGFAAAGGLLLMPTALEWRGLLWERVVGSVAAPILLGIAIGSLGRMYGWRWVRTHPDAEPAAAASEYRRRRLWWAGVTASVAALPALLPAVVVLSWFGFFIDVDPGHGSPYVPLTIFWASLALAAALLGAGLALARRHAPHRAAQP